MRIYLAMSCKVLNFLSHLTLAASVDGTAQTSLSRHAATSRVHQSPTLEVTGNDDEAIGDRWDDEEDWGSLEVGFIQLNYVCYVHVHVKVNFLVSGDDRLLSLKAPEKGHVEADDWNTDWSGMSSSKKKASSKGVHCP